MVWWPWQVKQRGSDRWEHWTLSERLNIPPRYTASIDAALKLVPEPWRLQDIWQSDCGKRWHAGVRSDGQEVGTDEARPTPAIAICIAALKARTNLNNVNAASDKAGD